MNTYAEMKPLRNAGLILGVGMGGFIDGILFHQILQIHNMLSNRYFPDTLANEQLNMVWDGLFHAVTWVITAIGISMLWKAAKRGDVPLLRNTFVGSLAFGWGLFNVVEGIIDHEVLQLHHVVQRATGSEQVIWDMAFLAFGVALIGFGIWLRRLDNPKVREQSSRRMSNLNPSRV